MDVVPLDVEDPELGDQILGELREGVQEGILRDPSADILLVNGRGKSSDGDAGDDECASGSAKTVSRYPVPRSTW